MDDSLARRGWSGIERKIAAALRNDAPASAAQCPNPDVLTALLDETGSEADRSEARRHLRTCAICRQEYIEMRLAIWEADKIVASPSRAAASEAVSHRQSVKVIEAETVRSAGRRPWWRLQLPVLGYSFAGACASVLLIWLVGIRPLRQQVQQLAAGRDAAQREYLDQQSAARNSAAKLAETETALSSARSRADDEKARAEAVNRRLQSSRSPIAKEGELAVLTKSASLLDSRGIVLMGGGGTGPDLDPHPRDTVVLEQSPVLTWKPFAGVTEYRLRVERADATGKPAILETTVKGSTYRLPKLTRGQAYNWTIAAIGAKPSRTAWFAVMDDRGTSALKGIDANIHLQHAELLRRGGAREAAIAELNAISPDSPAYRQARSLIEDIRSGK